MEQVKYPKFEFSDLLYRKTVVSGHTFVAKEDENTSNLVVCSVCGLEGWGVREAGVDSIKSYSPNKPCTSKVRTVVNPHS
jgi:hypothetical protein